MHVIPEWLELVSLAFCLGAIVCRLWVVGPAKKGGLSTQVSCASGTWSLFYVGIGILIGGSIVELLVRSSEIIGRSYPDFLPVVSTVLLETHYGHVWVVRMVALLLLALSCVLGQHRHKPPLLVLMLLLALVVTATASASGHASDTGDFSVPEITDWVHLVAACLWGGGLMVLSVSVLPNLVTMGRDAATLSAQVAGRFSRMAGIAVGVIAFSAVYNFWYYVRFLEALPGTSYGLAVFAKIILFLALICSGAFNRYVSVPLLQERAGLSVAESWIIRRAAGMFFAPLRRNADGPDVMMRFRRYVRIEAVLVIGVLLCAAVLRHEIPARHAAHMGQIREGGSFHKMDDNHEHQNHLDREGPEGRR